MLLNDYPLSTDDENEKIELLDLNNKQVKKKKDKGKEKEKKKIKNTQNSLFASKNNDSILKLNAIDGEKILDLIDYSDRFTESVSVIEAENFFAQSTQLEVDKFTVKNLANSNDKFIIVLNNSLIYFNVTTCSIKLMNNEVEIAPLYIEFNCCENFVASYFKDSVIHFYDLNDQFNIFNLPYLTSCRGDMYVRDSKYTYGHTHSITHTKWDKSDPILLFSSSLDCTIRTFHFDNKNVRGISESIPSSIIMQTKNKQDSYTKKFTNVSHFDNLKTNLKHLPNSRIVMSSCQDGSIQVFFIEDTQINSSQKKFLHPNYIINVFNHKRSIDFVELIAPNLLLILSENIIIEFDLINKIIIKKATIPDLLFKKIILLSKYQLFAVLTINNMLLIFDLEFEIYKSISLEKIFNKNVFIKNFHYDSNSNVFKFCFENETVTFLYNAQDPNVTQLIRKFEEQLKKYITIESTEYCQFNTDNLPKNVVETKDGELKVIKERKKKFQNTKKKPTKFD